MRNKTTRVTPRGDAAGAPTRQEFEQLESMVEDLERRVSQNRKDLDLQFQRLAELQAVIDRIQIAGEKSRVRLDTRPK